MTSVKLPAQGKGRVFISRADVMSLKWPFTTSVKPLGRYFSNFMRQKKSPRESCSMCVDSWASCSEIRIPYTWGRVGEAERGLVKLENGVQRSSQRARSSSRRGTRCLTSRTPPKASLEVLRLRQLFWNVLLGTNWGISPKRRADQGLRRNKHPKIQYLNRDWLGSLRHFANSLGNYQKIILVNPVKTSFQMIDW